MNGNKNDSFGVVAVQLSRKMWQGNNKLWAEEVGLDKYDLPDIVKLGHKKMYPKHYRDDFVGIYMQAYHYLKNNSLPFIAEHIRAVPKRNLTKVIAKLEQFKELYLELAREFKGKYAQIKEDWKAQYPTLWPTMENFYPSPEELEKKFDLTWNIFEIRSAEFQSADAPEVVEAYAKAKQALQQRYMEMVEESISYLRGTVLRTVTNLRDRLKEGRVVRSDTLDSVRNVESWFAGLNIFGDRDVEASLKKLREAMAGLEGKADVENNEEIIKQLGEAADEVVKFASNLGDVDELANKYRRTIEF